MPIVITPCVVISACRLLFGLQMGKKELCQKYPMARAYKVLRVPSDACLMTILNNTLAWEWSTARLTNQSETQITLILFPHPILGPTLFSFVIQSFSWSVFLPLVRFPFLICSWTARVCCSGLVLHRELS